ncbi:hypothetical protein CPC16_004879 [Podila verticillata]|nr:hypothetical protein CPC16_004879 [Podila verticillata]
MTKFIHLRKYESISLQYVLQGFKMSECGWLQDSRNEDPRANVRHLPPSASEKQFEILCEFLYWLFDGFLVPLLQASFYVTDSSYQKNKLFYYRHELWRRIMKPAVNSLQERMFIKMDEDEIALCRRPFAIVRFLPKTNDLRPIINLRKKATRLVNGSYASGSWSMNQMLSNAFLVLACERNRQFISSSAIGMSDLYHRLKQLKTKLVDPTQPNQSKLYFVKVDIRRSFDSINQDKLMEVVDNVLREDRYVVQRYSKIMPTKGQITKLFVSKAVPVNELPNMQFLDHAYNVAETSKHAVLVDKVVHPCESKQSIMSLIQTHVQDNIIRFGKGYFRQTTGIPQGSILSPALCRFVLGLHFVDDFETLPRAATPNTHLMDSRLFYDDMENGALSGFTHQSDSALLRLADDFLFVSRSKERATAFLNVMAEGHPEYGCFINEHKTVTNFDVQLNGEPLFRIAATSSTPKLWMPESISRDIKTKTVLLNVYQNFVFCAMKFHVYTQELIQDPVTAHHIQKECLAAIVLDIFKVCYGLLHNGRRSTMGIAAGAKFEVAERHVKWLGATAFRATLPAIPLYGPLKDVLKERILVPLNNTEKGHFKRKLSSVVNDARNEIMKDIKYTVAHHKY